MSQSATSNPDKTIVERRSGRKDDKSRQAVRNLRSGLPLKDAETNGESGGFSADLLKLHAKVQSEIGLYIPMLFCAAALIAQMQLNKILVLSWLGIGIGLGMLNYTMSKTYQVLEPEQRVEVTWQRKFMALQCLIGLNWAILFVFFPILDTSGNLSVYVLSGLVCVTAIGLLSSRLLKYGPWVAIIPSILVVGVTLALQLNAQSLVMVVFLLVILFAVDKWGTMMRTNRLNVLKSQAERDQLVMELEASRSISEEARRRAEDANLAKSRFLATMSHELRTPLNAILGFSEVMTNEVMGPIGNVHYKEYLGDIHRSGAHLLKLINEILDLSRVEAGRYELNEEATNLAYAAEESQQMIKLKASQKGVNLIMQIQPDLPQIWADARAIRQVILNLLSNALKFTPSGGTIWLKAGWTASGGQYISIKDTGPGIPEEEIPIVLSSFGQGSIAIKSAEQGTGLGLPIVQALVHMHDGTFDLKSRLRVGTEVIATFPRSRVMEVMPAIPVTDNLDQNSGSKFIPRRKA